MQKTFNVLFLCTGNTGRSIMAEGLLNLLGRGRFKAYSAGSKPGSKPNPFALEQLQKAGYDTGDMHSKSWDVFEQQNAPQMDMVITVCSKAASETCPIWPGHPATAHWEFDNPAGDTDEEKRASFFKVFNQIKHRVELLTNLPDDKLENLALKSSLQDIANASLK